MTKVLPVMIVAAFVVSEAVNWIIDVSMLFLTSLGIN